MKITITESEHLKFNIYRFYIIDREKFLFGYLIFGVLCLACIVISWQAGWGIIYDMFPLVLASYFLFKPFFGRNRSMILDVSLDKDHFSVKYEGIRWDVDLRYYPFVFYKKYDIIAINNNITFFFTKEQFKQLMNTGK